MRIVCMIVNKSNSDLTYKIVDKLNRVGFKQLKRYLVDNDNLSNVKFNGVRYNVVKKGDIDKLGCMAILTSDRNGTEEFIEPAVMSKQFVTVGNDDTLKKLKKIYGNCVTGVELVRKYEKQTSAEKVNIVKYDDATDEAEAVVNILELWR